MYLKVLVSLLRRKDTDFAKLGILMEGQSFKSQCQKLYLHYAMEDSDVDILATFSKPVGLIKLISAENYMSELLNLKVDLIPSDEVRQELQDLIFSEALPV